MSLPSPGQLLLKQWLRISDDQEAALLLSLLQGGYPWQKTTKAMSLKSKAGITLSLLWHQAYYRKNSPLSCCKLQEMLCSGSILSMHSLCKVTLSWLTDATVLALKLQSKNILFCHYRISKAPNSAATQGLQNTRDQHSLKNLFIQ